MGVGVLGYERVSATCAVRLERCLARTSWETGFNLNVNLQELLEVNPRIAVVKQ